MPKQQRNHREKGEQGKESSTEEENSTRKKLAVRQTASDLWGTSSSLMLQEILVRHKGMTKDLLCESLIDGSKKAQPMIKIKPTMKNGQQRDTKFGQGTSTDGGRLRAEWGGSNPKQEPKCKKTQAT
jgi:hypothetical protein